ncbi:TetR/AcrR family transcriptional regulator [Oceanobacillus bengalensis]|uniref:TetR/AcrR family transcriptional regulator n=1 Tax=Oceanobacillus bengalensis TaxID=1435466 RepID=A0A494Z7Z1_9BACI|nr:TetR/AcrR family transcriptional regulator [Oceanobacillus bengalensis]RKQ18714.1 TetR/AcrR family transcriptional regulator [Oceanobacillus bengalensis]
MGTKSQIIEIATALFQEKGYNGVGLNEIINACKISKGALYHHFPNGKEELLIACLGSLNEVITKDIEEIFDQYPTIKEAMKAMIEKLIAKFETEGTITSYTFSSIVSEMGSLSEAVRIACSNLYTKIEGIYSNKLQSDGLSEESANSIAVTMTAAIEGGILLCLTNKTSEPLKMISQVLLRLV